MLEIKLIFDECLSEPMMQAMRPLLEKTGVKLTLRHVVTYQRLQGVPDRDWIPQIGTEGGWIIISTDLGKHNRSEQSDGKLPYLCRRHRVTHILLTPAVHALKGAQKALAITSVWNEIVAAATATRGTRFKLRMRSGGGFVLFNDDTRTLVTSPIACGS